VAPAEWSRPAAGAPSLRIGRPPIRGPNRPLGGAAQTWARPSCWAASFSSGSLPGAALRQRSGGRSVGRSPPCAVPSSPSTLQPGRLDVQPLGLVEQPPHRRAGLGILYGRPRCHGAVHGPGPAAAGPCFSSWLDQLASTAATPACATCSAAGTGPAPAPAAEVFSRVSLPRNSGAWVLGDRRPADPTCSGAIGGRQGQSPSLFHLTGHFGLRRGGGVRDPSPASFSCPLRYAPELCQHPDGIGGPARSDWSA